MNSIKNIPGRKLCIAPMMDHTDRHFRYFLRLISRHVYLYTEMLTTGALLHGDRKKLLSFSEREHPLALQLGGSNPVELAQCTKFAQDAGYDEVNLNIGCPSNRVQSGRFGACLMTEPELVADCVASMQENVEIPVTVKTRTGIDEHDSYEELALFIEKVSLTGCCTFIIHARKALLNGLSPRENREIPELNYEMVYRLKKDFPSLEIIINGGFKSLDTAIEQYEHVDGVMIGRAACDDPYFLADVDKRIYGSNEPVISRHEILDSFMEYVQKNIEQGVHFGSMSRHILGLFQGQTGARTFRRIISENAHKPGAGIEILKTAQQEVISCCY